MNSNSTFNQGEHDFLNMLSLRKKFAKFAITKLKPYKLSNHVSCENHTPQKCV